MKKRNIRLLITALAVLMLAGLLAGCKGTDNKKIQIWSTAEDYRIDLYRSMLNEKFPDYDIAIEYMTTGKMAAQLFAEGETTACDIVVSMDYWNIAKISDNLAVLDGYDTEKYLDNLIVSDKYIPEIRSSGTVIVNTAVLSERGLSEPASYDDLLKPEYKGLVSMPDPKSSSTGYLFLKAMVNARGEDEAFAYFDKLAENVKGFTTSGSGPVNELVQKEVAIGLGMTGQAVTKINEGEKDLKILFFDIGAPSVAYGNAIIKGKEDKKGVSEVFKYLNDECQKEQNAKFFPEQVLENTVYDVENYPKNIKYADMSNDTPEEKDRLLGKWMH